MPQERALKPERRASQPRVTFGLWIPVTREYVCTLAVSDHRRTTADCAQRTARVGSPLSGAVVLPHPLSAILAIMVALTLVGG